MDGWLEARGVSIRARDDSSAPRARRRLDLGNVDLAAASQQRPLGSPTASPVAATADGAAMTACGWWPSSSIATLAAGIGGFFGCNDVSGTAAAEAAMPAAAAPAADPVAAAAADTASLHCVQAVAVVDTRRAAATGTTVPALAASPAAALSTAAAATTVAAAAATPPAAAAAAMPSPYAASRNAPCTAVRDHYEILGLSRRATPQEVMLGRSRTSASLGLCALSSLRLCDSAPMITVFAGPGRIRYRNLALAHRHVQ